MIKKINNDRYKLIIISTKSEHTLCPKKHP